jgi:multidrug resistance efflux pump
MKKREMSPPQAGAANTTIIPTASLSIQTGKGGAASIGGTETDTEIAPLIQKVGAASIAEIDRLIAELQEAKSYLLSEGERIEKEMVRYANLTQMALASAKIIFDAVSQWHPARKQQNASEVTAASTEQDIGAFRKSPHHSQWDTSELGQAADAAKGMQPLK